MTDTANYPVLGFIGGGNMAQAIIGGLVNQGYPAQQIWVADPTQQQLDKLAEQWPINTTTDNNRVAGESEVLMLAVKPQVMKVVTEALREALAASPALVISIAAGIPVASLERWLGAETALVRCMPNTPALVMTGASGLYANAKVTQVQRQQAEQMMAAIGIAQWVEREDLIDAVIAVSGSGPAYYFMMMEAMIEAGIKQGLSREVSTELTLQTALGAAKMAQASDVDPAELRRRVCSPNGTTERAVQRFQQGGLPELVEQAMVDCADRAREMAVELGGD
ncbi:pyrroline-5-carboxylate reductase [Motiliproteus sp.]|uniref:pyrroline-5-carboxylate reductase n=1 Tax=Motiliproteus sp. TaxID=1898955 RepID=UPI003BAA58D1